jgi:hypothetical protein
LVKGTEKRGLRQNNGKRTEMLQPSGWGDLDTESRGGRNFKQKVRKNDELFQNNQEE